MTSSYDQPLRCMFVFQAPFAVLLRRAFYRGRKGKRATRRLKAMWSVRWTETLRTNGVAVGWSPWWYERHREYCPQLWRCASVEIVVDGVVFKAVDSIAYGRR